MTLRPVIPKPSLFRALWLIAVLLLFSPGVDEAEARPGAEGSVKFIDTPHGRIYAISSPRSTKTSEGAAPVFSNDTYSFHHRLAASSVLLDGPQAPDCKDVQTAGMQDNTVLFDGLSELLDPYLDGTQPLVFEFETPSEDTNESFFNSFSEGGEDLFPEGFEDPENGTPLDSACVEIGIDDTLDGDSPVEVTMAMLEASGDDGEIIPPTDITSLFSDPWDGRLSLVFPGMAGQGINGMVLELQTQESSFGDIFADGFESGDASSWTDSVP